MSGSFHPVERVVIPVQGSDREYVAQQWAVEFAAALGIGVYAIHVVAPDEEEHADHFAYLESAAEKWGVDLKTRVSVANEVVREIVDDLQARDLVVIGTRKLADTFHVGSVAAELVRQAPCPVQIVRLI